MDPVKIFHFLVRQKDRIRNPAVSQTYYPRLIRLPIAILLVRYMHKYSQKKL